jgi:flagellar biogenesis protein FliO
MHDGWSSGWDWFWMTMVMILWIAVIGGAVYAAVRLALKHQQKPPLEQ